MKNKGFSLIELIIVITIMVILVATITPVLIKYINKSRISSDVKLGREIAMAIMSVVVDESVNVDAKEQATPCDLSDLEGSVFRGAVCEHLSVENINQIVGKSKEDIDGNEIETKYFYTLDADKNKVEVFYGKKTKDYQVYPVIGEKLVE